MSSTLSSSPLGSSSSSLYDSSSGLQKSYISYVDINYDGEKRNNSQHMSQSSTESSMSTEPSTSSGPSKSFSEFTLPDTSLNKLNVHPLRCKIESLLDDFNELKNAKIEQLSSYTANDTSLTRIRMQIASINNITYLFQEMKNRLSSNKGMLPGNSNSFAQTYQSTGEAILEELKWVDSESVKVVSTSLLAERALIDMLLKHCDEFGLDVLI